MMDLRSSGSTADPKTPGVKKMSPKRREKREAGSRRERLSRSDMLFLLSILEGELQARDEVITVLRARTMDPARLEARYGITVLCALKRDSLQSQQQELQEECLCGETIAALNNLIDAKNRWSKRMQEQLLDMSKSHKETLNRLAEQDQSHKAFIRKTNYLTSLLEEDRERLKLLNLKERQYFDLREKKQAKKVSDLIQELKTLKAFALLIVNDQQCASDLLEEQRYRVKVLTAITDDIKQRFSADKALQLLCPEVFSQTHETMTAKLYDLNQQQRQQIVFPRNKSDNLEGTLRRETWTPSTLSEMEVLRRRVVEMDGKDDEFVRMRDQCLELERRLDVETKNCSSLKDEVEKLNGRIDELDRIERALGKSKKECTLLKGSLEKERDANKILSGEVDTMKNRVRELEVAEGQLERSEAAVKNDLAKLRSLTVALVEERKAMAERLQQAEEKLHRKEGKKAEQGNTTVFAERFKEEQALRSKAELEKRILVIGQEKDELQGRLTAAEDRNVELQNMITLMKKRMLVLENRKEKGDNFHVNYNHHCQTEENRVKQLTQELDQLQKRLQEKQMLDRELMKVEKDFQSLEIRFKDEQTKCRTLTKELEVAKKELSRYQQAEKHEVNQEHLLLCCLQKEQVKSRLYEREINTLKEKLQKLMGTEESITRVQTDHSTLQDKLVQQEARNKALAREKKELSGELNRIRQAKTESYREHDEELHLSSKEIQTEPEEDQYSEYTTQGFVGNEEMKVDPNHNVEASNKYLAKNMNTLDNAQTQVNGEVMMLTHSPGQPLHIKVTPHHSHNSATLEISSPTTDTATSFTSKAVIPTTGTPPKQRITIIQNSTMPVLSSKSPISSPDSTYNGTPVSRMLSPNSSRSVTPDHNNSPIQIFTVRTCSPDPADGTNPAAFGKSPEQKSNWPHLKSNCTDQSPSVITTEDSKIHIHLGSPYLQPHSIPQSGGPYYLRHEQTTQVLANGCHVTGVGKITSSITISPSTSPTSLSTNSRWPM